MDDFLLAEQNYFAIHGSEGDGNKYPHMGCAFPPQDGRWVLIGLLCLLQGAAPDWSLHFWPKLVAGLAVAVTSVYLAFIFIYMGASRPLSFLLPGLLLSSPIVSEISLWNTALFISISLMLAVGALANAQRERALLCLVIPLAIVAFIYEIYLTVYIVGTLTFYAVRAAAKHIRPTANDCRTVAVFLGACLAYIVGLVVSKELGGSGRGLVENVSLASLFIEKAKGTLNLLVNVYLPVFGMYDETSGVYSWWKLGPMVMFLIGLSSGLVSGITVFRTFLWVCVLVLLPFLPTLPLFAASQSPESWRVSIPILVAFLFALAGASALVLHSDRNRLAVTSILFHWILVIGTVVASLMQLYATIEESRLRTLENRWDRATYEMFRAHWQSEDANIHDPVLVVRINAGNLKRVSLSDAQKLTVAYGRRGLNSAFGFDFSWAHFLAMKARVAGLSVSVCEDSVAYPSTLFYPPRDGISCPSASELVQLATQCKALWSSDTFGFPWVHIQERRMSALCI